jgi:hypothetical protein
MVLQSINFQKQPQELDRVLFDNHLLAKVLPILERGLEHARILLKSQRSFVLENKNTVKHDRPQGEEMLGLPPPFDLLPSAKWHALLDDELRMNPESFDSSNKA